MHEFDADLHAPIQRPTVTAAEPTGASPTTEVSPRHAPRAVHSEASLLHLQRTAGNAGVVQMLADEAAQEQDQPSPVHDVIGKGGGAPLDESTRTSMESRFGQDFGDVRLHTDARASASAEAVGANAYTVGNDVVFRSGHFDSSSPTGQRTIAHELSHVVQQRSGPVDGDRGPGRHPPERPGRPVRASRRCHRRPGHEQFVVDGSGRARHRAFPPARGGRRVRAAGPARGSPRRRRAAGLGFRGCAIPCPPPRT